MPSIVVYQEEDVVPELTRMRLPKETLLDIFDRAIGERSSVNPLDPVETGGVELRRWMTRFLREDGDLNDLGWTICRHGQIEGIKNDDLRIKLAFTNTDARTGILSKQPSNVAEKGASTVKLTRRNRNAAQLSLSGVEYPVTLDPMEDYDFWYFCGHVSEDYASAEISRPDEMVGGFIRNFSKRIIVCAPGEKDGLRHPDPVPEDFAEVEQPTITRKV